MHSRFAAALIFGILAGPAAASEVSSLLMRARWSHEPTGVIAQAVRLLDANLDVRPDEKESWMQLGEALAIGNAHSKHASDASEAWRRAYQLDPADCHAGALAARWAEHGPTPTPVQDLLLHHPQCAEAVYLGALEEGPGSGQRAALLRQSIAIKSSADALLALAQGWNLAGQHQTAVAVYTAAAAAPALFPEDWRPDGWIAVHAHVGLAWSHFSLRHTRQARREYKLFLGWFNDPGPWHDLSQAEQRWHDTLSARFEKASGK